jgi:hypothetical protein
MSAPCDLRGPMLKKIRLLVMLYVLLFVSVGTYLSARDAKDWDATLWVDVYPVNADGSEASRAFMGALRIEDFAPVEEFFNREAARYEVGLDRPFRLLLAPELETPPPPVPAQTRGLGVLVWSLRLRWRAWLVAWQSPRPRPDITVFAFFNRGETGVALDRSTALERGLIAVVNLFAANEAQEGNNFVLAHELLHTLSARDKYDLATTLPRFPEGFADPQREPTYPQTRVEIMGGRIPIDPHTARMPSSLAEAVVGRLTAAEIGWLDP